MILDRNYPRLKNLILISKSVSHLINEKDKIYPKANLRIYLLSKLLYFSSHQIVHVQTSNWQQSYRWAIYADLKEF